MLPAMAGDGSACRGWGCRQEAGGEVSVVKVTVMSSTR